MAGRILEQHSLECTEPAGAFDTGAGAATPLRVSAVDCVDIAFTGAATPLRVASCADCVGIAVTMAPCESMEHLERLEQPCVLSGLDFEPCERLDFEPCEPSIAVDAFFELGLEPQRSPFSGQDRWRVR